ncbi:hypothetical protein AB0K60_36470 [Thermopolyspora sp. NPDC052614]|uniref:hypothetical protein n=1 Tax=Thermopolyspora sp. NPDC052614 TaxID=3155682 RepID=UPI00342683E1
MSTPATATGAPGASSAFGALGDEATGLVRGHTDRRGSRPPGSAAFRRREAMRAPPRFSHHASASGVRAGTRHHK